MTDWFSERGVVVERRKQRGFSKSGTLLVGFLLGFFVSVLVFLGLAGYFVRHPQRMLVKAVDLGMGRVVEQTVESVPKDYVVEHQDEIVEEVHRLFQAYSQGRISSDDIRAFTKAIVDAIADKELDPSEIDGLLMLARGCAR